MIRGHVDGILILERIEQGDRGTRPLQSNGYTGMVNEVQKWALVSGRVAGSECCFVGEK